MSDLPNLLPTTLDATSVSSSSLMHPVSSKATGNTSVTILQTSSATPTASVISPDNQADINDQTFGFAPPLHSGVHVPEDIHILHKFQPHSIKNQNTDSGSQIIEPPSFTVYRGNRTPPFLDFNPLLGDIYCNFETNSVWFMSNNGWKSYQGMPNNRHSPSAVYHPDTRYKQNYVLTCSAFGRLSWTKARMLYDALSEIKRRKWILKESDEADIAYPIERLLCGHKTFGNDRDQYMMLNASTAPEIRERRKGKSRHLADKAGPSNPQKGNGNGLETITGEEKSTFRPQKRQRTMEKTFTAAQPLDTDGDQGSLPLITFSTPSTLQNFACLKPSQSQQWNHIDEPLGTAISTTTPISHSTPPPLSPLGSRSLILDTLHTDSSSLSMSILPVPSDPSRRYINAGIAKGVFQENEEVVKLEGLDVLIPQLPHRKVSKSRTHPFAKYQQWLKQLPNAEKTDQTVALPFLKVIDIRNMQELQSDSDDIEPDSSEEIDWMIKRDAIREEISRALAHNVPVLLQGFSASRKHKFNKSQAISMLGGPNASLEVQDGKWLSERHLFRGMKFYDSTSTDVQHMFCDELSDLSDEDEDGSMEDNEAHGIHRKMTAHDFVTQALDGEQIPLNLMDSVNLNLDIPEIILPLAGDLLAWQELATHAAPPGLEEGKNKVKVIDFDTWRRLSWRLFTSASYLTLDHEDSDGLVTYVHNVAGVKLWVLNRIELTVGDSSEEAIFKKFEELYQFNDGNDGFLGPEETRNFKSEIVTMKRGNLLIMPPGQSHAVLTVLPSILTGGHLIPWETLHLMELTRRWQKHTQRGTTNADHMSVDRSLARMAMSIEVVLSRQSIYLRCAACLLVMLWFPSSYEYTYHNGGISWEAKKIPEPLEIQDQNSIDSDDDGDNSTAIMSATYRDINVGREHLSNVIRQHVGLEKLSRPSCAWVTKVMGMARWTGEKARDPGVEIIPQRYL